MSKKSLIETNPHLISRDEYLKSLVTNVASSTAIETGGTTASLIRSLTESKVHSNLSRPEKMMKKKEFSE